MSVSPQMQAVIDQLRAGNAEADPDAGPSIDGINEMLNTVLMVKADFPGVRAIPVDAGGVAAEWAVDENADPDKRLLWFHGGGYVAGDVGTHRTLCADLSKTAGVAVLNVDYRLAPEHPAPAQFDDAVAAYRWVLENGPNGPGPATACFVGGDSAGGGLALAALMGIRDAGLAQPAAAIALSPWTDMLCTGASYDENAETDPMVARPLLEWMAELLLPTGADAKDYRWSPLYGDMSGLAPMLIQVSASEGMRDDAVAFAARAIAAGGDVTLEQTEGVIHVWHGLGRAAPEADVAIERVCAYIREHSS